MTAAPRRFVLMMLLFLLAVLGLFGAVEARGPGIQTAAVVFLAFCAIAIFQQVRAIYDDRPADQLFGVAPDRVETCWAMVIVLGAVAIVGMVLAAGDSRAWAMIGWGAMVSGIAGGFLALRRGFDLQDRAH